MRFLFLLSKGLADRACPIRSTRDAARGGGRLRRVFILTMAVVLAVLVAAGSAVGIAYWAMARRFVAGDAHALDGIVRAPVNEPLVLRNVSLWDGRGGAVQRGRSVMVNDGRIAGILDTFAPSLGGVRTIDGAGKTLIPGLIDAHVHLMYDSGRARHEGRADRLSERSECRTP